MSTDKTIGTGRCTAIGVALMGVIHTIATFTPLIQSGLECLPRQEHNAVLYFSLICGISLILSGLLFFLLITKIKQYPFLLPCLAIIAAFVFIDGILAVSFMPAMPSAWIVLVLGAIAEITVYSLRKSNQ